MPHAFAFPSATENADMKSVQQSDLGVIVPVYNRPTLLPDALESIVNQSRVPPKSSSSMTDRPTKQAT